MPKTWQPNQTFLKRQQKLLVPILTVMKCSRYMASEAGYPFKTLMTLIPGNPTEFKRIGFYYK